MFTGIVTAQGRIMRAEHSEAGCMLTVETPWNAGDIAIGESIAVNGCCLTVVEKSGGPAALAGFERKVEPAPHTAAEKSYLAFHLSPETLACTAPGWREGARVNLERALCLGDRLGGHLVAGHVDGMARVVSIKPAGDSQEVTLEAPAELARFLAPKGSVVLDGVSLTVNAVEGARFTVNIIPHTWRETTLGARQAGDTLNLEVDLLARYVDRLLEGRG